MRFEELSEGFVPDKILFRDEEMKQLNKVFDNYSRFGDKSLNILCLGGTGTGKTALIKKLMREKGEENFIYRTIGVGWTLNQILRSILDKTYSTTARLLHEVKEELRKRPRILVFDELNKLKDSRQLNLFMESLNEIWREVDGCPIILLTNIFNIKDHQQMDGKTALSFWTLRFSVYSENQLSEIFQQRTRNFKDKYGLQIPLDVFKQASSLTSIKGDSSARQMRRILEQCCMRNNFEYVFMKKLIEGVMEEDIREMFFKINEREKKFIYLLYAIFKRKRSFGGIEIITYGDLEKHFELTPRSIQTYLNIIEDYGFIKTEYRNKGRQGGRKRVVMFNEDFFLTNEKFLSGLSQTLSLETLPELVDLAQTTLN